MKRDPRCTSYRTVKGILCQSNAEEAFVNLFVGILRRGEAIKTPLGIYHPDFETDLISYEIKSKGTLKVMMGKAAYIKGGKISDTQFQKIKWYNDNYKPVVIVVMQNDKIKSMMTPSECEDLFKSS